MIKDSETQGSTIVPPTEAALGAIASNSDAADTDADADSDFEADADAGADAGAGVDADADADANVALAADADADAADEACTTDNVIAPILQTVEPTTKTVTACSELDVCVRVCVFSHL